MLLGGLAWLRCTGCTGCTGRCPLAAACCLLPLALAAARSVGAGTVAAAATKLTIANKPTSSSFKYKQVHLVKMVSYNGQARHRCLREGRHGGHYGRRRSGEFLQVGRDERSSSGRRTRRWGWVRHLRCGAGLHEEGTVWPRVRREDTTGGPRRSSSYGEGCGCRWPGWTDGKSWSVLDDRAGQFAELSANSSPSRSPISKSSSRSRAERTLPVRVASRVTATSLT